MKLHLYIALLLVLFSCKNGNESNVESTPNIVFILADDLGYAQVGCYGSSYYQTPNIDKLAQEGMRFTNAYAAAAICSPTRASIMTGKYPARLNITDFIPGNKNIDYPLSQPNWQKFLPLEEVVVAELLKEKAYQTALFGKWHISREKLPPVSLTHNPDKQGFDEIFVTHKPQGKHLEAWQKAEIDAHNVDTITNLSLDFIERNRSNPFFLFVSHNTIHDPLMEKAETIQKYKKNPSTAEPENHPVIAAMIERLDNSCGKIFDKITELGLDENTLVIFFSDNGGKHKHAKQTPLRAGKGWLYEGGIREPLIVKWKDNIEAGSVSESMISSIDFLPTFVELSGGMELPENVDGKSFLPVLFKPEKEIHSDLFWHYPHYHKGSGMKPASAVRSGDYKLIEWYEPELLKEGQAFELYNLKSDIGEKLDLSTQLPEKTAELKELLNNWKAKVKAQIPTVKTN